MTTRGVGPRNRWTDAYGTVLRKACNSGDTSVEVNWADLFHAGDHAVIGTVHEGQKSLTVSTVDSAQGLITFTGTIGQAYAAITPLVVPLASGSNGATGPTGPAGAAGATWREGTGVPSNGTGANGDFYLDDATGDVYKRTTGVYAIVANILGPQGDTGTSDFGDVITDSITTNQNNYGPTGLATCSALQVSCGGAGRTITGFDATDFVEGQMFRISGTVLGAGKLTLSHQSASSTSGNRISGPHTANVTLDFYDWATVQYLPTLNSANPFHVISSTV